jgi:hypothetical protein
LFRGAKPILGSTTGAAALSAGDSVEQVGISLTYLEKRLTAHFADSVIHESAP